MLDDSTRFLNALALLGISALLTFAFVDQVAFFDLPCPLCILQRLGFAVAGFGFALNLLWGSYASHYSLTIVASIAGATAAARQALLHIVPGSGTYGQPLFGLHFYTWAFIAFVMILIWCALLLAIDRRLLPQGEASPGGEELGPTARSVAVPRTMITLFPIAVFGLLVGLNALSTLLECSIGICPTDPSHYELLR
ncbi:disulfide bond formation protein B [Chelativorans alearense]|uniref:disulfide bond formation protein B n=1 Tax=Chelativorans alearense TaxID=2681495 RepID=UPI0013D72F57|nr:disulfide bond formation protein B [Chelativorans alearense]